MKLHFAPFPEKHTFCCSLAFEEAAMPGLVSPRVWGDPLCASGSPLPIESGTPSPALCHSGASPALGLPLPQGHGGVSGGGGGAGN